MTVRRKWVLVIGTFLGAAFLLWIGIFEATREYREREIALKPLLQSHAPRDQVIQALRLEFVDYSLGSTNHWVLEHRVPIEVRERAARFPGVLFHSTINMMTWVFFDSEGRLQDFYLCAQ